MFAALSEKMKTMDEFKEQGGILRDEMLSENLKVTSSGFIEGLVDLGAYTSPEQSMERCDHGLIVLFQPFSADSWSLRFPQQCEGRRPFEDCWMQH